MKIENVKYEKIKTKINCINKTEKINKQTGQKFSIIILLTKDGIFTNYESVWDKQMIDVEKLTKEDLVEISFVTKDGKYANFVNVKVINEKPQINDDDLLPF